MKIFLKQGRPGLLKSLILVSALGLATLLPSMAIPVEKLPSAQVSGGVGDDKQAAPFRDAVAMWWTKYGVSERLLHIHLFHKKLTPEERKAFIEQMEPMTDFNVVFNKKSGYHSVFYLPRVVLQVNYRKKPRNFAKDEPSGFGSSWYAEQFTVSGGSSDGQKTFKLKGSFRDGAVLTFSGTGGDRESHSMHRYEWKVNGRAPLVIKN